MQRGIVHIALCVNEYNARWILIVMLFIMDSVLSVHAQFDSYYHVLLLRNTFLARPNLSSSNFQMDRILSWRTRIGTNRISLIWFKPIIGEILILVVVYPLFVDVGWFIRDTSIRTRRETVSSAKKGWITFLKLAQPCMHGCFTMIYYTEDI